MIKADGSVLVHSDGGSYKPLNWMSPPCRRFAEEEGRWVVTGKSGETLTIDLKEVLSDSSWDLGVDPGLVKDGVESHLQELLAAQLGVLGEGWRLVRREYPTAIGPVDIMCRDAAGGAVAIEIKRRGEIDGVEQLTRYLELLNRDPLLAPVRGMLRRPGDPPAGPGPGRGPRHQLPDPRLRGHARHRRRHSAAVLSSACWRAPGRYARCLPSSLPRRSFVAPHRSSGKQRRGPPLAGRPAAACWLAEGRYARPSASRGRLTPAVPR